ncbi:MAG: acyl dehydratase [Streptosporangiales bacterium]|nr:acyl dehydratase [Streptosporangiales bacterium]
MATRAANVPAARQTGGTVTLHFEDLAPGQTYDLGSVTIDETEMFEFARRFDPQPFHVDPVAAKDTPFGGIIASGWYTGSLFMRMYADAVLSNAASHGSPGCEEMRWLSPIRAGDVLRGWVTVFDVQPSSKRPDRGTAFMLGEFLRDGEAVFRIRYRGYFGRRKAATGRGSG